MPNLSTVILNAGQASEESALQFSYTPSASGERKATLNTKNHFIDKKIIIDINTPAASLPTLNITDLTSDVTMGVVTSGYYTPSISLSGVVNIASAGWMPSGTYNVSDSSVSIGKIIQSILKNGTTEINSGAEITPEIGSDVTINITEGYNTSRTVVIKTPSAATLANTATAGVSYTDISSSAPVINSEDYLYIDAGQIGNVKIALSKLIPDDATISASTGSGSILSGESAYDSEGRLIVGTIPTYTGSYTID